MKVVAAIDLGTTSIRVGLFDRSGDRVALTASPLTITHPKPGMVEQDPLEMRDLAVQLLHDAVQQADIRLDEVAALGIANQRGSVVAWDASNTTPLGPVIGWQDTRTLSRVEELRSIGLPVNTSASCTKLEWLVTQSPECQAAAIGGLLRFGTLDAWLSAALAEGDVWITEPGNAGATGLYDSGRGGWYSGALELFGVGEDTLPGIVSSNQVVGVTSARVVGAEIPLAGRAGDQQASCFAHGLEAGQAKLTLGTSAMLDVAVDSAAVSAPKGAYVLPLWRLGAEEHYCHEGSVNTAGAVVEWLVNVGLLRTVSEVDAVAAQGRSGPFFLPALAGLGAPHHDAGVRGLVGGIGLETTAADLVRAALSGLAQRVAEVVDLLEVQGPILVDGGLSRSSVLLQLISDASGRPIRAARDPETSLRGAAMLAASSGEIEFPQMRTAATGPEVTPRTTAQERSEAAEQFQQLLSAARPM